MYEAMMCCCEHVYYDMSEMCKKDSERLVYNSLIKEVIGVIPSHWSIES